MPDNGYIALLVAVSAAVTWALRMRAVRGAGTDAAQRRGEVPQPCTCRSGVMVMLTIYTLRHAAASPTRGELGWLAIGVAVTAGLHLWRGQALVSILVGTAVYVVLMSAFA